MKPYNAKKYYCGPNKLTSKKARKFLTGGDNDDNHACYLHDKDFENGDYFASNWRLAKRIKNPIKGFLFFYPLTMIGGTFAKIMSWF